MKSFAHRGWSAGAGENTIEAFKKSKEAGIDGVEFDIRYGVDGKTIVVIHNRAKDNKVLTFEEALNYLRETELELLIECKEYEERFYKLAVDFVKQFGLEKRVTFFAFPHIASKFPWNEPREHKLGIIAPLPQHIAKYSQMYKPDMILLGWGDRIQRFAFKLVWSLVSLPRVIQAMPKVRLVVGVAFTKADVLWLSKQGGLYGYTIDNPNIRSDV